MIHFVFTSLTVLFGLVTAIILVHSVYASTLSFFAFRVFCCATFACMGALFWMIHTFLLNGTTSVYHIVVAYSFHLTALFAVFGIPERWFVGWFDIFGASHQIMHIGVVLGTFSLWYGYL